jgi:hypothetical protein
VDDTVNPAVTTCAVTRNIPGCSTADITGPSYSTVPATSSETVFENATNQGNISDACGITSVMYVDVAAGTCPTVVTRTWTIGDACGNSTTCAQTINITNTAPLISTCAVTRNIEGCNTSAITGPVFSTTSTTSTEAVFESAPNLGSASDGCAITSVTYIDVANGTCPIVVTRTWTISDACGSSTTCSQTINVDDTVNPSITSCAVTRNIEGCTTAAISDPPFSTTSASSSEAVFENATNQGIASDLCGIATVNYIDVASGTCPIVVTRTWTITDGCGNVSTCVQTINVDDTVAPVINACPVVRNFQGCGTGAITGPPYSATQANSTVAQFQSMNNMGSTSDACGITSVTYIDMAAGTCPIVVTRRWTISDACGNTSTCNQTINVDDTVNPAITICPVTRNIEGCGTSNITGPAFSTTVANSTEAIFENATNQGNTTDACGISSVTYIDVAVGTCPIVVTRLWTVSDPCGNTTTCTQTINVDDTASPVITSCAATRNIEGCSTSAITGPAYSTTSTASSEAVFEDATNQGISSDVCGITGVTYIDVSSGTCPIVVTRTWTLTDACGNTSTCNQTINVDDSVAPAISTCAVTRNIEGCNTDAITGPAYSAISATSTEAEFEDATNQGLSSDVCGITSVTYIDVNTGTCPIVVTRTWTVADACGNSSTCVQTINVDDTISPSLNCPADVTINCTQNTLPENTGMASATDACDTSPEVVYADITMAIPDNGYSIQRTWTATDACGNISTCIQSIIVTNPLVPDIIGLPFDTICSGSIVEFEAIAPPGIDPVTYDWTFGSGSNPSLGVGIGAHEVQYTHNAENGSTGAWVILTLGTPGCEDVTDTVANIHVNVIPNAAITASPGNPCVLGPKTFQPTAPNVPGYSYMWNFGSGANPATANTYGPHTIEYFSAGSKTVQLIVFTNEEGASCGDTSTVTFTVNLCPGNITGKVLLSDGTPLGGVNVRLYADQNPLDGIQDNNTAIRSVFTTSAGVYSMASLTPGYYVIVQIQPVNYISIDDEDISEDLDSVANVSMTDNIIPATIEPSETDADNIFTEILAPGVISGYVFEDYDNNDQPAPIEGLPGVTIDLHTDIDTDGKADPGGYVASTITSSSGGFMFDFLDPGSYVLAEHQPDGYNSVIDEDGIPDLDDVPNTNMHNDTIPVTVENGDIDDGNYFVESSICSRLVTSTLDDSPGSLRYMLDCAADEDTIRFHPLLAGQTLILNSGRIEIDKDIYLYSDVSPKILIQSEVNGAFKINADKVVEVRNLNIRSGLSGFPGAAFDVYGHLILWDASIFRNPLLPSTEYLIYNGTNAILTLKGSNLIETD